MISAVYWNDRFSNKLHSVRAERNESMTDAEAIALFLPILEGLDMLAEQLDLLVCVFGEQEEMLSDEAGQEEKHGQTKRNYQRV